MSTSSLSGRDFASTFDTTYDPAAGLRHGGASDRIRDRLVREEIIRLKRQGWAPATIVNLLPFPLAVNLGDLGWLAVPACEPGQVYARHVIRDFRISMRDLGDGNFNPVSVLPNELAQEVQRAYAETGGVLILEGDAEPSSMKLSEAREHLGHWHRREYQKAVDAWARYRQHKFITERQRDAAHALLALGEISSLPEWVVLTRERPAQTLCPACDEEIKPTARLCRFCKFPLDQAWLKAHDFEQEPTTRPTPARPPKIKSAPELEIAKPKPAQLEA